MTSNRRARVPRTPALLILALAALTLAGLVVPMDVTARADASNDGGDDRMRPHPKGVTEGYADGEVVAFVYPQQFYCTADRFDDLDGVGHRGDGRVAAEDPDEFQFPNVGPPGSPCIVGDSGSGSLPAITPDGRSMDHAELVWAILPFFDGELVNPEPTVDVQCPEPGPPITEHKGVFGTCTMHPSFLHAEPSLGLPAGDIVLPNHSHIIRGKNFNPIWWQTIAVRVFDRSIWPDVNGRCPANPEGEEPCLTSVDALRAAQRTGQAGPDVPSNVWLFFDSREVELDHH